MVSEQAEIIEEDEDNIAVPAINVVDTSAIKKGNIERGQTF